MNFSFFSEEHKTLGAISGGIGGSIGGSVGASGGISGSPTIKTGGLVGGTSGIRTTGGGSVSGGVRGGINGGVRGGIGAEIVAREVSIQVRGSFFSLAGALIPVYGIYQNIGAEGQIGQELDKKGWTVIGVSETAQIPGRTFVIDVSVSTDHDDTKIVNNIRRDLSKIMTVTDVRIIRQSAPKYIEPSSNAHQPGSGNFLDNLALGLGVSTPIAMAGGAILLLLILRR